MSPEQARGHRESITTRSDVYGLGTILYELLTGQPPFRAANPLMTLQLVLEGTLTPPEELNPKVDRDLASIALKCLQRDASHRYQSAGEVADDLDRWLRHEPISAREITPGERVRKWVRRHPAIATLSAAIALTFLLGTAAVLWQWSLAQKNLVLAEKNLERAQAAEADLTRKQTDLLRAGDELRAALKESQRQEVIALKNLQRAREAETDLTRKQTDLVRTGEELRAALSRARRHEYIADINLAQREWDLGNIARFGEILDKYQLLARLRDPLIGFEWRYLQRSRHLELVELKGHERAVNSICFSPDGKRIATASLDNTARIWDAENGRESLVIKGHTNSVLNVCFSPDGKRIATASLDNTARIWDVENGRQSLELKGHLSNVTSVCFSSDGKMIVTAGWDDTARIWDAKNGRQLLVLNGHRNSVRSVCFSPDGKRIATASDDNTARIWDAESGREFLVLKGHANTVHGVCFSPDGKRIATASFDKTARIWIGE